VPIEENVSAKEEALIKAKQKESYQLARKELQNKIKKVKKQRLLIT